jgi:uncharacterized protein with PhoU and TrkA domain
MQTGPNSEILIAMKEIVLACKTLTEISEYFEKEFALKDQDQELITSIKTRLSLSLTKLMQKAKECASINQTTETTQSIKDLTAELTSVVVELVKTENNLSLENTPISLGSNQSFKGSQDMDKKSFKVMALLIQTYLERTTDSIVVSIKALLEELRNQGDPQKITDVISDITEIVQIVLENSTEYLATAELDIQKIGYQILAQLDYAAQSLSNASITNEEIYTKAARQQAASSAYEVAKVQNCFNIVHQAND